LYFKTQQITLSDLVASIITTLGQQPTCAYSANRAGRSR